MNERPYQMRLNLVAVCMLALGLVFVLISGLGGCAATPQASVKDSYDAVDAVVRGTNQLALTRAISKTQATHVSALAKEAKAILDEAADVVSTCEAAGTAAGDCSGALTDLNLAAGVLGDLQTYVQAQQVAKIKGGK